MDNLVKDGALSLVICLTFGKAQAETLAKFNDLCAESLVNVFKIEKTVQGRIILAPLNEKQLPDPKLVCIIIELLILNKLSPEEIVEGE